MAKNVVGLFDSQADAQAAVQELRNAGFDSSDISYLARNSSQTTTNTTTETGFDDDHPGVFDRQGDGLDAAEGAGFGATSGAVMGGIAGLLVGLGALAIPGIGPAIAAGTLATTLGSTALGAGIGAATGGLIGALVGAGIPEEEAHVYAESVRRGGTMVMVNADDESEVRSAVAIMTRHNVVDIDRRSAEFRQSGWSRFDEPAPDNAYQERVVGSSQTDFTTYRSEDEGTIERNASRLGNAVERGLDADIDNDGDVGRRDPRNNI